MIDLLDFAFGECHIALYAAVILMDPSYSMLGEWEAKRGSTSEVWTITEKVKGKTYTVTGLENTNKYPFEAEFDSSSNMLVIRSQSGLGTLSHKDGDIDVCIYGGYYINLGV